MAEGDDFELHMHAISIDFMHYNFVRIHQTLRCTPAMEAKVTDRLWSIEEMVAIVDEYEDANRSKPLCNFCGKSADEVTKHRWPEGFHLRHLRRPGSVVAWAKRGARINRLSPGLIDRKIGRQEFAHQEMMAVMLQKTPAGRWGTAEEIAQVAVFVCPEPASFVTGIDILIDGGMSNALMRELRGAS